MIPLGTSLVVLWLRPRDPNAVGMGPIPGQGTRSCMLQPRAHMPQLRPGAAELKKKKSVDSVSRD